MTKNSLISFDPICPLMGSDNRSGYRLIMENLDFKDVLNFLCDNFGEGSFTNGAFENENWSLREGWRYHSQYEKVAPKGFRLLVFNKIIVDRLFTKFNVDVDFDNSNTLSYYIHKAVEPLLFSKITEKRVRKLKTLIADQLRILGHKMQWYDIEFNWDTSIVYFSINGQDCVIKL